MVSRTQGAEVSQGSERSCYVLQKLWGQPLHLIVSLTTNAINMAFCGTPAKAQARQQLEASLIAKWKSPFNKQNWTFWGAPL